MPAIGVLDSTMLSEEMGGRESLVFLHGHPTSSYLWRRALPRVGGPSRSGKPDVPHRFADHARYLDAWFDGLALDGVELVGDVGRTKGQPARLRRHTSISGHRAIR